MEYVQATVLKAHYAPTSTVAAERFRFNSGAQLKKEMVATFAFN